MRPTDAPETSSLASITRLLWIGRGARRAWCQINWQGSQQGGPGGGQGQRQREGDSETNPPPQPGLEPGEVVPPEPEPPTEEPES